MRPQSVYAAINAAAEMWGMDPADIIGRSKVAPMSIPRLVVAWWCHERLGVSYPAIARKMGGRHHTTILAACWAVNGAIKSKRPTGRQQEILRLVASLDAAWTRPAPKPAVAEPEPEPDRSQPGAEPEPVPVAESVHRDLTTAPARQPAKVLSPNTIAKPIHDLEPGFPKKVACLVCRQPITIKSRNDPRRHKKCGEAVDATYGHMSVA